MSSKYTTFSMQNSLLIKLYAKRQLNLSKAKHFKTKEVQQKTKKLVKFILEYSSFYYNIKQNDSIY